MNSPKKLLFFSEQFGAAHSGAENDLFKLASTLVKRAYEVHILSYKTVTTNGIQFHSGLQNAETVVKRIKVDLTFDWGFSYPADIYRLGGGIHRTYLAEKLQAYSGMNYYLKQLEYFLKRKHVKTIQRQDKLLKQPQAQFLTISNSIAKQVHGYGVPFDRIQTLHNGVDTKRFCPENRIRDRQSIRHGWQVNDQDIIFLFVAHNLKLKNLNLLRQVFAQLYAIEQNIGLVVIGKNSPSWTAPYLHYHGISTDLPQIYSAVDALLHPSYFDAFANVVLEAMSSGLPVIVSHNTGASELVQNGYNGYTLPVNKNKETVKKWIELITQLIQDRKKRQSLGKAARETALQYDYQYYLDQVESFLHQRYLLKVTKAKRTQDSLNLS